MGAGFLPGPRSTPSVKEAPKQESGPALGFGDASRNLAYAQRAADDRFAIDGRGIGYHFGSAIRARFDRDAQVYRALGSALRELFPELGDVAVTQRSGGVSGVPGDLCAALHMDEGTGIARDAGSPSRCTGSVSRATCC